MNKFIGFRVAVVAIAVVLALLMSATVLAEENMSSDAAEVTQEAEDKRDEIGRAFEEYTQLDGDEVIANIATGDDNVLSEVVQVFFGEIKSSLDLMVQILAIAIVQALLSNSGFGLKRGTLDMASLACTVSIIAVSIVNATDVFESAERIIVTATEFLQATFPAMVTLSAVSGGAGVSVAVSPMLFFVAEIVVGVVSVVVFPLLSGSLAFAAAEVFSEKKVLKGVSGFIRKTCYWIIGMITVVFTAVTAVRGIVGGSTGVGGSRLLKCFLKFIPVVGDLVSDSLETIVGGLSLIKSVSGVLVMVGVAIIVAIPVIKIFAVGAVYKLSAMLAEAIGAEQGAGFVREAGNTMIAASGMVIAVGVMFIVVVAAVVSVTTV